MNLKLWFISAVLRVVIRFTHRWFFILNCCTEMFLLLRLRHTTYDFHFCLIKDLPNS